MLGVITTRSSRIIYHTSSVKRNESRDPACLYFFYIIQSWDLNLVEKATQSVNSTLY